MEVNRLILSVRAFVLTHSDYAHVLVFSVISAPLTLTNIVGLFWSFGSNYILPIILNAAQLAISTYFQSSNTPMLIDSAKVVINIASASMTMLHTKLLINVPASSALLEKADNLTHDMLKVVPVPPPVEVPDHAIGATVSARTLTAASGPATES